MPKGYTTKDFVERARKIHGDRFDYSNVQYKNYNTPVEIICKEHGSFMQKPDVHLRGHGCPKCAKSGVKLSQEEFENRVYNKFPNIDLSDFKYANAASNGICKCKTCGNIWESTYITLINSSVGCPKCAIKSRAEKRSDTKEMFISKLAEKHPNVDYDFSNSVYVNSLTKMDVVCLKHGVFTTKPNWLMNGNGCPRCNDSHLEREVRDKLLENGIEFEQGKYYNWLLNKSTNYPLTLDFYIPSLNIAIECQGVQHFIDIEHFGRKHSLSERIDRDRLKKKLCNEHNVKLIYYLKNEYNCFMKDDDIYFNDVDGLMEWIRNE